MNTLGRRSPVAVARAIAAVLCAAAGATQIFGCASRAAPPDVAADRYAGPPIHLEADPLGHIVVIEAPSGGWSVTLDGVYDAFKSREVFITAAHFNDPMLLADCNNGDPYCEMIRRFCLSDLAPGDALLDDKSLAIALGAEKFKTLRGRMKVLMLATIYGMGDRAIAAQAGTTLQGAQQLRRRFFARYETLHAGIQRAERQLQARGYTVTATGLRRYRGAGGRLSAWERHWAVNAPIQGGSACVQKLLLPRLAAFMRRHGGRIVLPIFDAMLVGYPREARDAVLAGAPMLMVETMRELYPATRPRVDTTAGAPWCWNKDDHADSIERFLADVEFKL